MVDHAPVGRGQHCKRCRQPREKHRVKHEFMAASCRRCGQPSNAHKQKHPFEGPITLTRIGKGKDKQLVDSCLECGLPPKNHRQRTRSAAEIEKRNQTNRILIGMDGEGFGRWPHRYVMLCWRDEKNGERYGCIENPKGLTTKECLDFIVDLPESHGGKPLPRTRDTSKVTTFGFSFRGYDVTKILQDMPNDAIYALMRPDLRRVPGERALRKVSYLNFELDFYGGKLIVSRLNAGKTAPPKKGPRNWHEFVAPPSPGKKRTEGKSDEAIALCATCARPRDHEKHTPRGMHEFKLGRRIKHTVKTETFDGQPRESISYEELCAHCGRTKSHRHHAVAVPREWQTRTLWDCFTFYQSSFVAALVDWKTTDSETLERIADMKKQRGSNNWMKRKDDRDAARRYCLDECNLLGKLMRQFLGACQKANIDLAGRYHGAGSLGGAMLKSLDVDSHLKRARKRFPKAMLHAIMCGYFGGRFEHSVLGPVDGPIFGYDLSAAYPYRIFQLPCLVHGRWRYVTDREAIEGSHVVTDKKGGSTKLHVRAALVHYGLGDDVDENEPWGPFPFRAKDGSITFPIRSAGGWVWRDEYLAGERAFRHVEFRGAWIYESACDCQIFARIPEWYVHRLLLGKEGPGIVLKLGVNSQYGQMARSVGGGGRFQCWPWASIITGGCRAQVLDALTVHEDRRNLLAVATDGIYTRERLKPKLPHPLDTGTAIAKRSPLEITEDRKHGTKCKHCGAPGCELAHKPLGGWEETVFPKGMFLMQPGVYTPLDPDEKMSKKLRARGIGRVVLREQWKRIRDAWRTGKKTVELRPKSKKDRGLERFVGAKTGIYAIPARRGVKIPPMAKGGSVQGPLPCPRSDHKYDDPKYVCSTCHNAMAVFYVRSPAYGEWVTRKVIFALAATPKRRAFGRRVRNKAGTYAELLPWSYVGGNESAPYSRAAISPEARALKDHADEMWEQPDADFQLDEYEDE